MDTLPYSRELHYTYYQTLFDGTSLDPLDRSVEIDHRDFEAVIKQHQGPRMLFYIDSQLDSLYPAHHWRRLTWEVRKHSQRTKGQREKASEMLLCNYPELTEAPSLWTAGEEVVSART